MQLEQLPDEALERVLGLAGLPAAPSTSRVSKRWRTLVFQAANLWHRLDLNPAKAVRPGSSLGTHYLQDYPPPAGSTNERELEELAHWLDGKHFLLSRVGRHVRRFGLKDSGMLQQATLLDLLAKLRPEQLEELRLASMTLGSRTIDILPRLSCLTALELTVEKGGVPSASVHALAALHRLRDLRCSAQRLPGSLVTCIAAHLTQASRAEGRGRALGSQRASCLQQPWCRWDLLGRACQASRPRASALKGSLSNGWCWLCPRPVNTLTNVGLPVLASRWPITNTAPTTTQPVVGQQLSIGVPCQCQFMMIQCMLSPGPPDPLAPYSHPP